MSEAQCSLVFPEKEAHHLAALLEREAQHRMLLLRGGLSLASLGSSGRERGLTPHGSSAEGDFLIWQLLTHRGENPGQCVARNAVPLLKLNKVLTWM